jgi:hypothetical protein
VLRPGQPQVVAAEEQALDFGMRLDVGSYLRHVLWSAKYLVRNLSLEVSERERERALSLDRRRAITRISYLPHIVSPSYPLPNAHVLCEAAMSSVGPRRARVRRARRACVSRQRQHLSAGNVTHVSSPHLTSLTSSLLSSAHVLR